MKKLFFFLALLLFFASGVRAQSTFNTTPRDQIDYTDLLSDVWGYVAPDGTEYALVCLRNSISVVSLADPDNIVEVANVASDFSVWRDIKTYGNFAYVVADQSSSDEGILVVDLSGLPGSVTAQRFNSGNTSGANLTRAHNIFIDEIAGLAYIAGANVNGGGMVIYDVATTPGTPAFVAFAPATYAHDVYVGNGVMYASEIYAGRMALYDVSDPLAITLLGTVDTPAEFTHNIWATANGVYAFTTDERANAPTTAYNVSDPLDIEPLGEFRPRRSLNTGVIPHNVHVKDNFLVISHYTDGVEIVDATDPENMIEVGYFDPWAGTNGGFNGVWGAYPYLPSGLVLASDISSGLYVFNADYPLGARMEGTITGRTTGAVLNGVSVTIASAEAPDSGTNALGNYKTGQATPGTYNVTFALEDYQTLTVPIELESGLAVVFDTSLIQLALPVTLTSFTATSDGKTICLDWTTGTETGSDRFEVERSQDGRNFTTIGTVRAAGESVVARAYNFTDETPISGANYYRLRQVDFDGRFALSELRRIDVAGPGVLLIFPNPVERQLTLSRAISGAAAIYRSDGQLVRQVKLSGNSVDVEDLVAGQYYLRVAGETLAFVKR
jgi:choice-of-anchor B domain-containing protein